MQPDLTHLSGEEPKKSSLIAIFLEFIRKYPWHFWILFFVLVVEGAVAVFSILAVIPLGDYLLDTSLKSPSQITANILMIFGYLNIQPSFWLFGAIFVGFNFVKGVLDVLIRYVVLKIKYTVTRGLIDESLGIFFKARWGFFSSSDQGRLINTLNKELNIIGDTMGHIATMLAQTIQLSIYLMVPLWLNYSMTLTALVLVLVFSSPFLILNQLSYSLGKLNTATSNKTMGVLNEIITAAKLILGYARQKQSSKKYLYAFDAHVQATLKSQTLGILVPSMFRPIGMLAVIIAMGFSLENGANISELAAVLWSLLTSLPILSQLLQNNISIKNFLPSYEQLLLIRKEASLVEEVEGDLIFNSFKHGVELRNVCFNYPGRTGTLKNIGLNIVKGNITALVGESGSGKSTITDLVLGLQVPETGSVLLDGRPLEDWKQNSFREKIGYVPQDSFLFHASIRENLLWSYDKATENELWKACKLSNAEEFIKQLPYGIDTIVGDRGVRLSGGQRQRIALARALLRKPELLILDEATSSLDTESEYLIQQSIDSLAGQVTILVIAHRLSTIIKADMIYVMKKGEIVEQGSYEKLVQENGKFAEMVQNQSH